MSAACNAITITDASIKLGKNIRKSRYLANYLKPALKIAVFGSSGSGKSCFLGMLKGVRYDGESTRYTEIIKYTLPDGRRLHFYDCPGQPSYRDQRTAIKREILKGKFHAIINVVCYGYNETATMTVKPLDNEGNIRHKFLEENRKIELDQLQEWISDITADSKIKWILTLINKEDIWKNDHEEVHSYYASQEYRKLFEGVSRVCPVHTLPYCSIMALFAGKPMMQYFTEKDKIARHVALIENISHYIKKR